MRLVRAETASDVLSVFASSGGARGLAGSGTFNSVNFSTCLHRLARLANARGAEGEPSRADRRRAALGDPRFAVFVCSLCEALAGVDPNASVSFEGGEVDERTARGLLPRRESEGGAGPSGLPRRRRSFGSFSSREHSNIAWAVAKLRFAPPGSVLPVVRSRECLIGRSSSGAEDMAAPTREDMTADLVRTSLRVRAQVLAAARERASASDPARRAEVKNMWIPTLSQLAGKLLDVIAANFLDMLETSNSQELANILWAFATAGRADGAFFDPLAGRLVWAMERMRGGEAGGPKPQEHSNSVWAFATAGVRGPGQRDLIRHLAASLDGNDGGLLASRFKPQELSNTAWAVATLLVKRGDGGDADGDAAEDAAVLRVLRVVARSLLSRVSEFKSQEISNTVWAFATVGFGCARDTLLQSNRYNDYIYLASDADEEDRELVGRALEAVAGDAGRRLDRFRPQELNNLAWGYARLGHRSAATERLFRGIGEQILRRRGQFTPQDVGTTLWSFASAEYYDEDVYRAAASRLNRRRARSFKPQELSNTVWALATAGVTPLRRHTSVFDSTLVPPSDRPSLDEASASDPVVECLAAASAELMRRPEEFKEQEIKDVLWGLSRAGVRHPAAFRSAAAHLVGSDGEAAEGEARGGGGEGGGRGLANFSPQGIGNLAWSYAKQAQLAFSADGNGGGGGVPPSSSSRGGLNIGSSGRQAVYETSCLDVGEMTINRLFSRIAESALNDNGGMDRFKAQDLSNTAWAFATLGLLHRGYFDNAAENVIKRLSTFVKQKPSTTPTGRLPQWKGQEIANLIWAYATLNHRVPAMVDAISVYVAAACDYDGRFDAANIAGLFKRQELANVAWSCAVLEQYPKELMEFTYTGLLGSGDANEIGKLNRLYGDGGLQSQAIMSLFYVQMATDTEAPHLGLSLPRDFPGGWGENPYETAGRGARSSSSKAPARDVDLGDAPSMLELSTSRLQIDVSEALRRNGFRHVQEHVIGADDLITDHGTDSGASYPPEFLSIDIADPEEQIGVEVDGPAHYVTVLDDDSDKDSFLKSHAASASGGGGGGGGVRRMGNRMGWEFMSNGRRRVNGPTALKHRLLCHLGWCVIHVPFWEWRALGGDGETEDAYCRNLLEEVIE